MDGCSHSQIHMKLMLQAQACAAVKCKLTLSEAVSGEHSC